MEILDNGALIDAGGLRLGHASEAGTGVTVAVIDTGGTAGVDVRGSAPGTRETDVLDPTAAVQHVTAIVLTGGSAFGLAAVDGVMTELESQGRGLDTGFGLVPIVPAAVIFDLPVTGGARPSPELGRRAVHAASADRSRGNVGAGTGATIGKYLGVEGGLMKGGLGQSAVRSGDLIVSAAVVVNALGDIYDESEKIAGTHTESGFLPTDMYAGQHMGITHTTIGIIASNAALTKPQASKVASAAHDGLARSIRPVHTMDDGDTLFAVSTGTVQAPVNGVCYLAAEAVRLAVLDGVRSAQSLPGIPAVADLQRSPGPTVL
ncbi:P1 family peptidase [Flaviflexus huanghaiensis]|uniref:P1 family peptidase n=1 Tax=Flaviflexus huanghaiensis TaxID=1111473 RepID=UPI0015F793A8|nr:P1 family peptidase [Flaviflexus huanghaiensis]